MYRWVNEYRQDGNDAFPGKGHLKPEDAELRHLKRENEELREENEILKSGGHLCKTSKMKYNFNHNGRCLLKLKRALNYERPYKARKTVPY